jgi:hypothetical protein
MKKPAEQGLGLIIREERAKMAGGIVVSPESEKQGDYHNLADSKPYPGKGLMQTHPPKTGGRPVACYRLTNGR